MKNKKNLIYIAFLSFIVSFSITSCDSDPSKKIKKENVQSTKERLNNTPDFPIIEFNKNNHDFGEIKEGEIAETEGHHPDLWFGWGYARIKIFTHAIKGLAESDFILAAKIDKIN